jgi:hypothetical protein
VAGNPHLGALATSLAVLSTATLIVLTHSASGRLSEPTRLPS